MSSVLLLALIYFAFISLGLPDGVVGVAWPAMRQSLGQPVQAAGWITLVVTACAAISGFASGAVLRRFSTGKVVTASGFATGLALVGFAHVPSFAMLLLLCVPLGLGAGAVDAAMNHFVARHYSSRHMNWLHGCWGMGATLGPILMGAALAQTDGRVGAGAGAWRSGYLYIAALQLTLALLFLMTLRLWQRAPKVAVRAQEAAGIPDPKPAHPMAQWLAPGLFFLYAGVEVGTSLWSATVLIEQRHFSQAAASLWVSCFFGSIMGGRFATGLISQRLGNRRLVRYGLSLAIVGALLFGHPDLPPWLSLAGLMLLGLGCAPVYPSLMHEAARRFDAATAQRVIGLQVGCAYLGCMLVPMALGQIGATSGLVFIIPLIAVLAGLLLWFSALLDRIT